MPHKHKRKRGPEGADFDLPPTQRARPLPAVPVSSNSKKPKKIRGKDQGVSKTQRPASELQFSKKRDKRRSKDDDTPRAFKRLMAVAKGTNFRSGLDDGNAGNSGKLEAAKTPRIRPGEDMRSFAARVDAELSMSGLTKKAVIKDGKDEAGLKVRRTKKERKMHKLYEQWRAEDVKIKDKRDEEEELAAEREMDDGPTGIRPLAYAEASGETNNQSKSRRKRRQDLEDDPWLELKRQRAETKVGLHEVARAPPELHKKTTRQLKVSDAAVDVQNVPRSAGSLKRREELQVARNDVVEAYRKIREHEQAKLNARKA